MIENIGNDVFEKFLANVRTQSLRPELLKKAICRLYTPHCTAQETSR